MCSISILDYLTINIQVLVIRNLSCKYIYIYINYKIRRNKYEFEFEIFYGEIKCNGDRRSELNCWPMADTEYGRKN